MRIGLIGCGSIAQVHAKSILALGSDFQLAAVADSEFERAVKLAGEYGAAPYQDWQELLERERPDAVHICTPHYLHVPMTVAALRKGIHVFTEKPPVISWEQLENLKTAVSEAQGTAPAAGKARLAVCFQNRFNPGVRYVKDLLQEGSLGRLKGARGFVTWCRDVGYYRDSPWRGNLDTEGGGALINQGIHTLDLIQYLVGSAPVSVDSVQSNFHLKDQIEVEDMLTAFIRYPDAQALFYVTTAYAADVPPIIELQCERGRVRLEGDEVRIWRDGTAGDDQAEEKAQPAESEKVFPARKCFGKSYWGAGHKDAIEGFYKSILEDTPYLLDFDQVEESVELMLRIYSAARGAEKEENYAGKM